MKRAILMSTVNGSPAKVIRRRARLMVRTRDRAVAIAIVMSLAVTALPASSSTTQGLSGGQSPVARSHYGAWLPAGLYRSLGATVASIGSWLARSVSSSSTESVSPYEPSVAYITPAPAFIDSPTNLTVTAAASTQVSLSWTAPSGGVNHYQVERSQSVSGPFLFLSNASGTSFNDTTVGTANAYLYRVRAIDSGGLSSTPSNMALGTAMSFEFSSLQGQVIKARHLNDLRIAVNAVRSVAGLPAATWLRVTLIGLQAQAVDVQELRNKLGEALTALGIAVAAYQDPVLATGGSGTLIKAIHIEQLQARATRGSSNNSGPLDSDSSIARLDPLNQTGGEGENPLSRNFNWTLPLVGLPGRAGMDLGLSLSYNSLVWTRSGNSVSFNDDGGFPGPGFRIGFPVVQPLYFNSETGKDAFLLISPDGSRTELRQVGSSTLYEAADSSHLLLDTNNMVLRTTDGTQLSFVLMGGEYKCTQLKDRNGNYLTITYTGSGRIDTVIDTLARSIKFNYDASGLLTSITQTWNQGSPGQVTHFWATFTYSDTVIQTNFSGLTVYGPSNNSTIKTLSKVTLTDGAHCDFSYTTWGQIWKVSCFAADNHLLNYRAYNLPQTAGTAHTDCPRFTERRDWAQYWNQNSSGIEQEVLTSYAVPVSDTWTMPDNTQQSGVRAQVTMPDGTSNKIYFIGTSGSSSGWRRGLQALVNTYDSTGVLQRQAMTSWTQDNVTAFYPLNPRVTETNTYDQSGNRARTQITYQQFTFANGTSCHLPRDVYEYAANAGTILRSSRTEYNSNTSYTDRRILGLVSEKQLFEGDVNSGGALSSKVGFNYDEAGSIQGADTPAQHDNSGYAASFVTGRGNVSSVKRYDVNNTSQFTTNSSKYNTAGAVVSLRDALNHEVLISYADSFSDGNNARNTLAYPTTVTDPDLYSLTTKYHFDFGAVTYKRTPQPNTIQNLPGPEQSFAFDTLGRLQQITNLVNNAYTRFEYPDSHLRVDTYTTIQDGLGEAHSFTIADGLGRTVATARDHPGSVGGFSGQRMVYDLMGRVIKTSNPTETGASGAPSQWNTAGDDAAADWIYTEQTYDWSGRPLVTINPSITGNPANTTTKQVSYTGCGCAGEVVTLTDERGRTQRMYSDVLGRRVKLEVLNWDGSVYTSTVNSYNARDQVTQAREYAGPEGSSTFQDTATTYDGFGRIQSEHQPEQTIGTAASWTYNADDTIASITDARGASQTFEYNNRHLLTSISYSAPFGISVPSQVSFTYDAAGNRTSMIDGLGGQTYQYNLLSQITQEARQLPVGVFTINYTYNLAGQLTSVTDPFSASIFYTLNVLGQLKSVTGTPYAGTSNYITDVSYRAWGAPKSVSYPGSTSTIAYNARLLPTQFRLTANSNGGGIIRENYGYFSDGMVGSLTDLDDTPGTNPPVTLRFLSRSYAYDHVGRVVGSGGTGIGSMPGVPYSQAYAYDQFGNMTSRSGSYYNYNFSQPSSDTGTYINNRRNGWTYNAEGQVLSSPASSTDKPRNMSYDAAGRMVSTSETSSINTITYAVAYDGDGWVVYESNTNSLGPFESSYIVRSTVLGGEILTRLDQSGNKKITHVPARGLLFATQRASGAPGAFVDFRQRNPLGTTETARAVYDPLGNYIPFQSAPDPRPPAGSFTSASMSGLAASLANPHNYGTGCLLDGSPVNCSLARRLLASGLAERCPYNDCGPRTIVYKDEDGKVHEIITNPFTAYGDGTSGFIPAGLTYADFYEWVTGGEANQDGGGFGPSLKLVVHEFHPKAAQSETQTPSY